jgi:predicted dinucleotide-binding enzyme
VHLLTGMIMMLALSAIPISQVLYGARDPASAKIQELKSKHPQLNVVKIQDAVNASEVILVTVPGVYLCVVCSFVMLFGCCTCTSTAHVLSCT